MAYIKTQAPSMTSRAYNVRGFDKKGKHEDTGTQYNSEGYNLRGFDKEGIHKITGTKYNLEGLDNRGFDKKGIHNITMTRYNTWGYDKDGLHPDGVNVWGFNKKGINRETGEKWDRYGYNIKGIDRFTGTKYNLKGLDKRGFDKEGKRQENRWYKKRNPKSEFTPAQEPQTALQRIDEEVSKSHLIKSFGIKNNSRHHWSEIEFVGSTSPIQVTPKTKDRNDCIRSARLLFGIHTR